MEEQSARISLSGIRSRRSADELQSYAASLRDPRAELDRRPIVADPAERDDHRSVGRSTSSNHERHVAGSLRKHERQVLDRNPLVQEDRGRLEEGEDDVAIRRQADDVLSELGGNERRGSRDDPAMGELARTFVELRGPRGELHTVRHQPGYDQLEDGLADEGLAQVEQLRRVRCARRDGKDHTS